MRTQVPLLEIKNLHVQFKVFEGVLKVLNGVNIVIREKEKVGLVGETGCGKTTTIKSVLRILPSPQAKITGGQIFYRGRDILTMQPREIPGLRRGELSAIFQDPLASLNPVFTVGQQLGDILKHSMKHQGVKGISKKEIRSKAADLLRETGMPDPERILKTYPVQLSGGMRQRVCISEALRATVKLLLADEPTTNLDVTIQDQILRRLDDLVEERGTSILLISHSLGIVRDLTERVYIMYAGTIVETTRTRRLFENPLHPYTKALLKTIPKLTGKGLSEGIRGRIPNYLNPPQGCRFHPRCDSAMNICRKENPPGFSAGNDHVAACWLFRG
ncbi:MAG: ABC transporter ATP-binding protein [Spirochaetes bacterium]|nr:ABC transporter ATP-binding protein [Spirochaetota bacterium]